MYPTRNRAHRQLIRDGLKTMAGLPSAWCAHRLHKCLQDCWYCRMGMRRAAQTPLILPATAQDIKALSRENLDCLK